MNDLRQAAQAALEAMSMAQAYGSYDQGSSVPRHLSIASRDLRAALAQSQAEPSALGVGNNEAYAARTAERDAADQALADAWAALLDAGESPICEDDTVANAIRRLTGRSLTLTVSTDTTFHGNYRITDGGRSRGVTIPRSDLADDMSDDDLRELYAGACETAAHSSVLLEPIDVEAFLKWARS